MVPRGYDSRGHPQQQAPVTQSNQPHGRHSPRYTRGGTPPREVTTAGSQINTHPTNARRSSTPRRPGTRNFPDFYEGHPSTVETIRGRNQGSNRDVRGVGGRARPSSQPPGGRARARAPGAGIRPGTHEVGRIDGRAPPVPPDASFPSSSDVLGLRGHGARGYAPPSLSIRKGQKHSGFHPEEGSVSSPGFGPESEEGVGSGRGKRGLPQPPGFVLHAVEVLRWLGVEGVTPEVLRKAKRGLRDEDVASNMWRALLRVCLLHLDATKRRTSDNDPTALQGFDSDFSGAFDQGRGGEDTNGHRDASIFSEIPLEVAVETCGHLLPLWGYRRSAFAEAVRSRDALQTREVLLALAWVLTEARVFHAFEQACLISPVPFEEESSERDVTKAGKSTEKSTSPHHRHRSPGCLGKDKEIRGNFPKLSVPRFPRDVLETPAVEAQAEEAFRACLSHFGSSSSSEAFPWREDGDGLERALGAARELMSCYGRLQGELRIVEGLEVARSKMLSRMRSLHEQSQKLRRNLSPSRWHLDQEQASSSKASKATPFSLCLSTKPEDEIMRTLSCVSKARAELERAEEYPSHTERWCRWVLSAHKEASCSRSVPSHASGTPSKRSSSSSIGYDYTYPRDGVDRAGANLDRPPEKDALEDGAADDRRIALLEEQQQELETRIRALSPPRRPIAVNIWSALIRIAEQEKHQHQHQQPGNEEQYNMKFVEKVRRAIRREDARMGQQVFVRELEEQRQQHRNRIEHNEHDHTGSDLLCGNNDQHYRTEQQGPIRYSNASSVFVVKGGGAGGREPEGNFSRRTGAAVSSGRAAIRGNARAELKEARRVNSEILGELLASYEGVMPFEIRRGKGHR